MNPAQLTETGNFTNYRKTPHCWCNCDFSPIIFWLLSFPRPSNKKTPSVFFRDQNRREKIELYFRAKKRSTSRTSF